jgi:hypothetical protein
MAISSPTPSNRANVARASVLLGMLHHLWRHEEAGVESMGSWPAFQHFTKQVVAGSQRAQHRTKTYGWDMQETVRRRAFYR